MEEKNISTDFGLVSIIMANYNCEGLIKETIDSVIAQSYKNWELLIIDDCSNDNSLAVVNSYHDERIKLFVNEDNKGAAYTRNVGIQKAEGRWIAFLDSDDIWIKEKLEKHLSFMQKNDVSFSFTDYQLIDEHGAFLREYKPKKDKVDYKSILKHNCIGCSTVIYDASKIGKVFMPEDAVKREDLACWLAILKTGTVGVCYRESLTHYRIRTCSVSSNKLKMMKFQWNVYRKVEKMSFFKSAYYLLNWAINGFLKYR